MMVIDEPIVSVATYDVCVCVCVSACLLYTMDE